jgi:hypothetical protein
MAKRPYEFQEVFIKRNWLYISLKIVIKENKDFFVEIITNQSSHG